MIAGYPFIINPGDRIAQGVFSMIPMINLVSCEFLDETSSGTDGFGSSGVQ